MLAMFNRRRKSNSNASDYYAMRQNQHEQVVQWAQELINGHGNEMYRQTLKSFLKRSPSGLEKLSPAERQRLWVILNDE